jgi:hypothetical protein
MICTERRLIWIISFGALLGVVFFLIYSFLSLEVPGVYNSPDENSNVVFARLMAESGQLHRFEPLNLVLDDRIHPRSIKVVAGLQVPGGFLGLPVLYGIIGHGLGLKAIPFITPALALVGVLFWGLLIGQIFNKRIGIFAGFLLLINPAWWYWASHTMMPNVLLMSLLLVATYFLLCAPIGLLLRKQEYRGLGLLRYIDPILAGICLGLALAVRPVIIYWLMIGALMLLVSVRQRFPWKKVTFCLVFAFFTLGPFLIYNQSLYGSWSATGYGNVAATVIETTHGGWGARLLGPLRPILFPLGFAPRVALNNFWHYGLKFFWWWSILVGASGIIIWRKHRQINFSARQLRDLKIFILTSTTISLWLVFFYGSWRVQDNPTPKVITIGSSYIRYWLPLFVLSTLPPAIVFSELFRSKRWHYYRQCLIIFICIFLTLFSGYQVFNAPQEGLTAIRNNLLLFKEEARQVVELTEENALIIVDHADKYLYPARAVLYPLRDERTYQLLPRAVRQTPTYYFGLTLPIVDLEWLQNVKLAPMDLTIETVTDLGEHSLYKFLFKSVPDELRPL